MTGVALTGGIASGKSFVADELARLGAVIVDSDVLARRVVEPGTPGLASVIGRFGEEVILPDGSLDRQRLGQIIFSDDAAREALNAIIHPRVRELANRIQESAPPGSVVVQVIPLLVETGLDRYFDTIVVVDVPEREQIDRLIARNALTRDQALARIRAQAPRSQRAAAATHVIDNAGTREQTLEQVGRLWRELTTVRAAAPDDLSSGPKPPHP